MKIKQLIRDYAQTLFDKYGRQMLPSHFKALDAMAACRSQCGEFYASCTHCAENVIIPLSCGHRSCPQCQNNQGEQWLEQQKSKLLPVTYFMVTLTLPSELRQVAWKHQRLVYDILFQASVQALQTIGRNNFGIEFGMTAVLHTHKRDKGYHPHIHIALPSGGIRLKSKDKQWKALPQKFIINEFALAQVFRGIVLSKLLEQGIEFPVGLPKKWVSNIRNVGKGDEAFTYLSRYLYRGVITENDILSDHEGNVTFCYKKSKTNEKVTKTQPAEDFLWALLKHVLPRRFRRVRDYGFIHGNAKKTMKIVQSFLNVRRDKKVKPKKSMTCKKCLSPMLVLLVRRKRIPNIILTGFKLLRPPAT